MRKLNSSTWMMAGILLVTLALTGCASPFVAAKPDSKTGKFQTLTELSSDENSVFSPIDDLESQEFIVLITTINAPRDWANDYRPYVKEMLEISGLSNFVDKTDLENFVIANNLGEEVPSLNNRIGYNQLSKYVGEYLIVATDLRNLRGDWWQFSITVYDPVSSDTKFHASKEAVPWVGMDKPILLPVFNALKKWIDESKSLQKESNVEGIET
jgi:hypothetical protein